MEQTLLFESCNKSAVIRILKKIGIDASVLEHEKRPICVVGIGNGYIQYYQCDSLDEMLVKTEATFKNPITFEMLSENPGIIEGAFCEAEIVHVLMCNSATFQKPATTHSVKPHRLITSKRMEYKFDAAKWDVIEGINPFGETSIWLGRWNDGVKEV
ncbi:hypothetical protein DRO61_08750 [Candidatus Bathyarchaeota archaeon]|nr:MAG: hypothetical protein DRO61_08750 [Candidatus Bathyarchaeota archaeon]